MPTIRQNPKVKRFDLSNEELDKQVLSVMENVESVSTMMENLVAKSTQEFEPEAILKGKILDIVGDIVIVDIGYKSEGIIPINQWEDPSAIKKGEEIEVLLESIEDDYGLVVLSKRKADHRRGWERVIATFKEGDIVKGRATRKIKGGLLVDIGYPVFLPASQVSIRRTGDIAEWVGREIECKVLKIDQGRRNIVVSRRKLLEETREKQKKELLGRIKVGDVVKGVVKNIADFGAFVDLGGIDGLLHITDMSWSRISHPSEMLKIDQEIEVVILKFDPEHERISLGLKQRMPSPWEDVETKYPVASHHKGRVVNVLSYGAFVKLETGIEGLVHISEMSWTRRLNHPSEMVNIGDIVDVVVLGINKEKQEISLGMKQVEVNPWTLVEEKYPPGVMIEGKVRNLTNYGAFVEIEEGIDGLLHVSDISWTRKVVHPNEVLKKGEAVKAVVLSVDKEKKRIALGVKQLTEDPWEDLIPTKFQLGAIVKGKITKITNFGVFVELERDLEGLLHVSELADKKVMNPEEVVHAGDEIEVMVIKVDKEERKIGLSLKKAKDEGREYLEALRAEQREKSPIDTEHILTDTVEDAKKYEAPAVVEQTPETGPVEPPVEPPAAPPVAEQPKTAEPETPAPQAETQPQNQ
jgi:small subunit ribosomal protein S1